jgi:required for meiotic nuclear division protein 1
MNERVPRRGSAEAEDSRRTSYRPDFKARAVLLADRIDLRAWTAEDRLASNPLTIAVPGGGAAVLFRYGVVVFFDVTLEEETAFIQKLAPLIGGALPVPETEEVEIHIDARAGEGMRGDRILLVNDEVERLQIVADILAKSVVLAVYEARIAGSFEIVEPLAVELERNGRIAGKPKDLARQIGGLLLSEHMMVGRFAVAEKPELLWERPDLEGLYIRLEDEFEIKERREDLSRKLDLMGRVVQTLMQLQEARHSLRLELYIVVLIVVEILLTVYDLFLRQL